MLLTLLLAMSPAWALDVTCSAQRQGEEVCETGTITIPAGGSERQGECPSSKKQWSLWSTIESDGSTTIGYLVLDSIGSCSTSYLHPLESRGEAVCENQNGQKLRLTCASVAAKR